MINISVVNRIPHNKGTLFTLEKNADRYKIILTTNALTRMEKWQISLETVFQTLLDAEEVLIGHNKRFIAHRCFDRHIIRAVYEYNKFVPYCLNLHSFGLFGHFNPRLRSFVDLLIMFNVFK